MNTKITRIDESEGRVEFSGLIIISWLEKSAFEKELQALIEKYAL
jgi:citrate synthase